MISIPISPSCSRLSPFRCTSSSRVTCTDRIRLKSHSGPERREPRDSPQDAEADLAVAVKVGVEADGVVPRGDQLDPRGVDGIVRWAAEQEEEEAALVRRVKRACDQRVDLTGGEGEEKQE